MALFALLAPGFQTSYAQQTTAKKPSLSLKATPPFGVSPLRVHAVVDIRDGSDDYAEFYCAAVEWEWGDGTVSGNSSRILAVMYCQASHGTM